MADILLVGTPTVGTSEVTYTINETTGSPLTDIFYVPLTQTASYRIDVLISGRIYYNILRKNQNNSAIWVEEIQSFRDNPGLNAAQWARFGIQITSFPPSFSITIIVQPYS